MFLPVKDKRGEWKGGERKREMGDGETDGM